MMLHSPLDEPGAVMARLVGTGSIEMSAHRPQDAAEIAGLLPAGMPVLVNHLPRHALADTLDALIAVREAGLEPVPHIAARRIASRAEATGFLASAVRRAGVRRVLLLGGDLDKPLGPYADAAALLSNGMVGDAGIGHVAFAAYPEGHPRISDDALAAALDLKIERATRMGLAVCIFTQFAFAPSRIIALARDLGKRYPRVPVHVGLAGSTNPLTMLKFARVCGVEASLKALPVFGSGGLRFAGLTDPGHELSAIARHILSGTAANIAGAHIFTFGGTVTAAKWMQAMIGRS